LKAVRFVSSVDCTYGYLRILLRLEYWCCNFTFPQYC